MATVLCLAAAGPARAGGWYFQVHGGIGIYNLDDVNDAIASFNEILGADFLDRIRSGPEAGFLVGRDLTPALGLGLGISRLWASSGNSGGGYLVELDLPADLYEISLDYAAPNPHGVRLGAGVTVGVINTGASILVLQPGLPDRREAYDGLGFHFAAKMLLDVPVAPAWSLTGQLGFRHALLNHLKVDGQTVFNPDSVDDKLRFNYGGLLLRMGVKFRP
jgi:hypothetical protein